MTGHYEFTKEAKKREKESKEEGIKNSWRKREERPKFTYLEKKEYESIEEEIAQLEERITEIENEMNQCATEYEKLRVLTEEKNKKELILEEKMERWIYLNDLAEKIVAFGGKL